MAHSKHQSQVPASTSRSVSQNSHIVVDTTRDIHEHLDNFPDLSQECRPHFS
ncbi:hypothetical protein STEG23_035944, partial [Scotinomys teguina]